VLLAGDGVRGAIYGNSDLTAAHLPRNAVTAKDTAAVIYLAVGVTLEIQVFDMFHRPHSVALGTPNREILA